jgi:hypothetical protein
VLYRVLIFSAMLIVTSSLEGDDQLEQTWRAKSLQEIEAVVRLKADAKRGALVLHKSAAFAHWKTYEPDAPASAFRRARYA